MPPNAVKRVQKFAARVGFSRDWPLIAVAAGIGAVTAVGAVGFIRLVEWAAEQVGRLQTSGALWLLPLAPIVGALATGALVHYFAREARGHGVPEVMDAVYRRGGKIRPRVAVVKSLASACTIGSGGSAGAEGPIVQIGAAIGSGIAQAMRIGREHTSTLVGCGAAAGIASVFNAPIAGVFFVLEIVLRDFSVRTFTPIVIAAVLSTAVTQAILGENEALFDVVGGLGGTYTFTIGELPSFLVLGLFCGVVTVVFTRALYFSEDHFAKVRAHPVVRPALGAALLGVMGVAFLLIAPVSVGDRGLPPFFGNGYEAIREFLRPQTFAAGEGAGAGVTLALWLVALIVVCKVVGTCLTLGSGGSGGVFAPSLFVGAAGGAAYGMALERVGLLPEAASPASYALVGMAALVAGTAHAPLTAILMVFEITRDVHVLLPIMLAAVLSTILAQLLMRDSIYTLTLRRRGVLLGTGTDLTILRKITAGDIPLMPHAAVLPEDPASRLLEMAGTYKIVDFVVVDAEGRYVGMVTGEDMRTALLQREAIPLLLVQELMRTDLPTVHPEETLDVVLDKFSKHDVWSLAVTAEGGSASPGRALGLLTRARAMRKYQQALAEE